MGKRSGKRAKAPAKIKDLGARTRAGRAAQVKGGCQNNLLPAVQAVAVSDGTSKTIRTLRAGGAS